MGEMQERLKGFFGLQTKPKVVTPEGVGVNVEPFTPPTHFDQAKVMDRPTMPPTRPSTPDSSGAHQHNGHKGRKIVAGVVVAAAGTGGYLGYNALQNSTEHTTPTPVTTIVDVTTPPLTSPETTTVTVPGTTEAPTTIPPTTTQVENLGNAPDVFGEYTIIPVGGVQLDIESQGKVFGFQNGAVDQVGYALLYTFAAQKPEFVNPDNTVNVDGYIQYLMENEWKDSVLLPETTERLPAEGAHFPPVKPSDPIQIDFSKPFVISNDGVSKTNGNIDISNAHYYNDLSPHVNTMFGVTPDGQLYFSTHDYNAQGMPRPLKINFPGSNFVSMGLGEVLAVTSHLGTLESTPEQQSLPAEYYLDPGLTNPTGEKPAYPLLDLTHYATVIPNVGLPDKFFQPL